MNCLRSSERWDYGFESHSRHGCLCVRLFCVCVVLCVGCDLATCLSLVHGVLPSVKWLWNWKIRGQGPTTDCRAIDEWMNEWINGWMNEWTLFNDSVSFLRFIISNHIGRKWLKMRIKYLEGPTIPLQTKENCNVSIHIKAYCFI
jgi:hypothetical protein